MVRRDDVVVSVGSAGAADPRRAVAVRDAIAASLDAGRCPAAAAVRPGPGGAGRWRARRRRPATLRGRRELAAADVVVVDRLAPRSVLDELGPGVLVLDVGKAPGRHPVPQPRSTGCWSSTRRPGGGWCGSRAATRSSSVVAARRWPPAVEGGVDVSVVPGVTSAFAVPAAAGIPVTNRGQSRQVTVCPDTTRSLTRCRDLTGRPGPGSRDAGGADGRGCPPRIAAGLLGAGMDPATSVAIVQDGWTPPSG